MISLEDYYNDLLKREEDFPAELRAGYEAILSDIEKQLFN